MENSRTVMVSSVPVNQSSKDLVKHLESFLGDGSVYCCKVKPPKNSRYSLTHALVQLDSTSLAKRLMQYGAFMNLFGGQRLSFKTLPRDLVAKPRAAPVRFADAKLHFGCQVSDSEFCVLWSATRNAVVDFGTDARKVVIYVNERHIDYKLLLSSRYIYSVHRHRKHDRDLLVLQLRCAPKIYHSEEQDLSSDSNQQHLEYYKFGIDTPWVRTTDFTPKFSIGESSSICLDILGAARFAEIENIFSNCKDSRDDFSLKSDVVLSNDARLVPVVHPPVDINIPYKIIFQVNALVQTGILSWPTLGREFFRLLEPTQVKNTDKILSVLYDMSNFSKVCYNPEKYLINKLKKHSRRGRQKTDDSLADNGLMKVHRVQITPTKVYCFGPEINVSNRVTRQFSEYMDDFLRLSFVDEDGDKLYATDLCPKTLNGNKRHTKLYKRILFVLKEGIVIGSKKFEFLAFSSSQVREGSVWMFASNDRITAENIRNWMGDFMSIRNVAKCAARMGQSFSSSKETLHVHEQEVKHIDDIFISQGENKYVFSDGIGKISVELAKRVASKCGCGYVPSAFQIRYGGYKGVVAVDPRCSDKLCLRPSMNKFDSKNTYLDVLAWTKFRACFLNRQIISLLSTLGVGDTVFQHLQGEVVQRLDNLLESGKTAVEVLQLMSGGENHDVLIKMLKYGYSPKSEPYLSMVLRAFRATKLLELKEKTRIFVENGRCLMGCLDETGILSYGQVFLQVSGPAIPSFDDNIPLKLSQLSIGNKPKIIKGTVIVAKNPCLHPGDVRILEAVDDPSLHHLVDCVVFPQRGKRPHPSECSGSDLDGDLYFISWDKSLIPPKQDDPMDYVAPPPVSLDHCVTIEEIQEFFVNYMLNDALGIISARHTVFADSEPEMARSATCLQLARLFSIAVDFPKTGVPAEIPANLVPKEYPDYMEKEDKPTYLSERVIGKLYRAVKDHAMDSLKISVFTEAVARTSYDRDLEIDGFEYYLEDALRCKNWYDASLAKLMYRYGIRYEAEIVSGNIFTVSKFWGYRPGDLKELIMVEMRALQQEARSWFEAEKEEYAAGEEELASAWYHVTYHPHYFGCGDYEGKHDNSHFISFPWIMHHILLRIKQRKNAPRIPGKTLNRAK